MVCVSNTGGNLIESQNLVFCARFYFVEDKEKYEENMFRDTSHLNFPRFQSNDIN